MDPPGFQGQPGRPEREAIAWRSLAAPLGGQPCARLSSVEERGSNP
jgi:hypothetical protein